MSGETQAEAAVRALGARRRTIFRNVANGVPVSQIMEAEHLSEREVHDHAMFVVSKIREYRLRRTLEGSPHASVVVSIDSLADIRAMRRNLFGTLRKIGDMTLGSALLIGKVLVQKIDESNIKDAMERVNYA